MTAPPPAAAVYDAFVSYNREDETLVREVSRHLRARGVESFIDLEKLPKGLPWVPEVERALGQSSAVLVFVGPHGPGTVQESEIQLAMVRHWEARTAGSVFPIIPVILPGGDPGTFSRFLTLYTWVDLGAGTGDATALDAIAAAVRGGGTVPLPSHRPPELCPYLGLESFGEPHAPFFRGRERYVDDLHERVSDASVRLIAVVGGSGSGKSSLVEAGLLPRLRDAHERHWLTMRMTPGKEPFRALAAAVLDVLEPRTTGVERVERIRAIERRLTTEEPGERMGLARLLEEPVGARDAARRVLLVVDQFEELFTLAPESARARFVETLTADVEDFPLCVLLTLRSDYLGQAVELGARWRDYLQRGIVLLGPMRRDELQRAIEEPARVVGLEVSPRLVERLLNDVEANAGNLPLLEFALTELWAKRRDGRIDEAVYGGVAEFASAIANHAERALERVPVAHRDDVARRVLGRLVRVAPGSVEGADTRARVPLGVFTQEERAVVSALSTARLLTTVLDSTSEQTVVEVTHEALIRHWPRLRTWLDQDREFLLWRQRLAFFVAEWLRAGRSGDARLRERQLVEAKQWWRTRAADFTPEEREFVRMSIGAERTARRWKAAAVSVAGVALVALAGVWTYSRTDGAQIAATMSRGNRLLPSAEARVRGIWLFELTWMRGADVALAVARTQISEAQDQALALARSGGELAGAGRHDDARREALAALGIARAISDVSVRLTTLDAVLPALAETQLGDSALVAARAMALSPWRVSGLAQASVALAAQGDRDRASMAANEAIEVARALRDASPTTKLSLASYRYEEAARALAAAGFVGPAHELARAVPDPSSRASALSSVSRILEARGHREEALTAAREAVQTVGMIEQRGRRRFPWYQMSSTLALLGLDSLVNASVRSLVDSWPDRADALAIVAVRFAAEGRQALAVEVAEEALREVRKLPNSASRAYTSVRLTGQFERAGLRDQALEAAAEALSAVQTVTDPVARVGILVGEAHLLWSQGQRERAAAAANGALAAARQVGDAGKRAAVFAGAAGALAAVGAVDQARGAARTAVASLPSVRSEPERCDAVLDVTRVLSRFRDYRLARSTADLCAFPDRRLEAYTNVVMAYLAERHPAVAKRWRDDWDFP